MKNLFMFVYKWSFLVIISLIWIGLYSKGYLAKFDKVQWALMIYLSFMSIFAFVMISLIPKK